MAPPSGSHPSPTGPFGWVAVAHSDEVGRAPMAVRIGASPVVLFRGPSGIAALLDRCPHRHAPLSDGRVHEGELQCPYHGWRFSEDGHCTHIPGLNDRVDHGHRRTQAWTAREVDGLIWLAMPGTPSEAEDPVPQPIPEGARVHTMRWRFHARADAVDALENFLDPVHTHFVHPGLVRREGQRREVPVIVRGLPAGVEAVYAEAEQSGFIARTFGADIVQSYGRYLWPHLAQLGYRDASGVERLCITASFVPAGDGVDIVAMVRGRVPRGVPKWLAGALIGPFLKRTVAQDRRILERVARHRTEYPLQSDGYAFAATDLLRPHIDRLRAEPGRRTPVKEKASRLWL